MMDDKTRIFEAIIYPLSDFFFLLLKHLNVHESCGVVQQNFCLRLCLYYIILE